MNEVDRFVASVVERLESDVDLREDPSLEAKSEWPHSDESRATWEVADLLASLANDPHIDGLRAVLYGPAHDLTRPSWLTDESVLRSKLLKHFDAGVVPRAELLHRSLGDGLRVDLLVVVDRSETPYVTRFPRGGDWVVRVRTSTARRTATRGEILALASSGRRASGPVRKLDIRFRRDGDVITLTVVNVGTVGVRDVEVVLPSNADASWMNQKGATTRLADLKPGEKDACRFFSVREFGRQEARFSVQVKAIADDGEPVGVDALFSSVAY